MSVNNYCRFCHTNLKIQGVISHSTKIFEKHGNAKTIFDQLRGLGLTLKKSPGKSIRACRKCNTTIMRMERDLPVFRRWEEEEKQVRSYVGDSASAAADKENPEAAPSDTPTAEDKLSPSPPTPTSTTTTSKSPQRSAAEELKEERKKKKPFRPCKWTKEVMEQAIQAMPNIRKQREIRPCKWSKETMEQAIQEVQAGRLTVRQAADQFEVPMSSLYYRISGRLVTSSYYHQKKFLSLEDENSLVEYCLHCASHGVPLGMIQVMAQALAIYNYRNPDKPKTVLGQTWWINFMDRHYPRLATATSDITAQVKESFASQLSPLVASGRISADLAQVLSKTSQSCNIQVSIRSIAQEPTAQGMSDVIKEEENSEAQTLDKKDNIVQKEEVEDTKPVASTLPVDSSLSLKRRLPCGDPQVTNSDLLNAGPSAPFSPTSAPNSASMLDPSRTPSHMSLPYMDQHQQKVEASSHWQTTSTPPASPSSSSSSSTTGPTTSTGHIAAKRQKLEKKTLRCGQCRQPYPPLDPEGLVLWVHCDNCHNLFHTICVSSEMDLDEDQFLCFCCLDV